MQLTPHAVLGEHPSEIVRRAIERGIIQPPPPPMTAEQLAKAISRAQSQAARERRQANAPRLRAPRHSLTPEQRRERDNQSKRESHRRARAALAAQGLTQLGVPRKRKTLLPI